MAFTPYFLAFLALFAHQILFVVWPDVRDSAGPAWAESEAEVS